MEKNLGHDFASVRVHSGAAADDAARAVNARAFTTGEDVVFAAGQFSPSTPAGRGLLAHELVHVVQQRRDGPGADAVLWRETAEEIKDRFTDWGGLNLREEDLGVYLRGLARAGNYTLVTQTIQVLSWSDRDDVAGEMMAGLTTRELIRMAHNPPAVDMLRLMRAELADWWGFTTDSEQHQADLLGAVVDEPGRETLGTASGLPPSRVRPAPTWRVWPACSKTTR